MDSSLGSLVLFLLLTFHNCSVVHSLYDILRLITRRLFWSWCSGIISGLGVVARFVSPVSPGL